jgi:hypothetical protein
VGRRSARLLCAREVCSETAELSRDLAFRRRDETRLKREISELDAKKNTGAHQTMRRAALALVLVASLAFSAVASEESGAAETAHAEFPMLEGAGDGGDGADSSASGTRQIVFGEKVALDELGPIIVNEDCTMRRITNWETMSTRERRGVSKRVVERNRERLERCRELEAGKEELRRSR